MPELLTGAGVYTHLDSDHVHYWGDQGATYHTRYSSWQYFRDQASDPFTGQVADPIVPRNDNTNESRSDWINRHHIRNDDQYSHSQTFAAGLEFIRRNHSEERWFLQVESFDPHEPFTAHRAYRDLYPRNPEQPLFDWPAYGLTNETQEQITELRYRYASLLSKCDRSLGDVLDAFDEYKMWDDTMLILWSDHGFQLGEHNAIGKNWLASYEEVSHTPFFVWDPRCPESSGQRSEALVQPLIDLGPTLLSFFGVEPTESMLGLNLSTVLAGDAKQVRDAAIFGHFDRHINITDGRYVYMRQPIEGAERADVYTLMPTVWRSFPEKFAEAELSAPLPFTKGMPVLRIPSGYTWITHNPITQIPDPAHMGGELLFDLEQDPAQSRLLHDKAILEHLKTRMAELMEECDAPARQFERVGLNRPG